MEVPSAFIPFIHLVSKGIPVSKENVNLNKISKTLDYHAKCYYHIIAVDKFSKRENGEKSKMAENVIEILPQTRTLQKSQKSSKIPVDSDDEPLSKIIKLNENVIDIAFKEEIGENAVKFEP